MLITKSNIEYNAETGIFKNLKNNRVYTKTNKQGYIYVSFEGKSVYGHRLAWFFVTGSWPKGDIDHIENNKTDNRIRYLRDCSHTENLYNRGKQKNNKSGFKGVYLCKGKYIAQIRVNGKKKHLGYFTTAGEASEAYEAAAKTLHGEFYYNEDTKC